MKRLRPPTNTSNGIWEKTKNNTPAQTAEEEFELMTSQLSNAGINLQIFDDADDIRRPDAIFPNNWVSFHQSGKVVLYPMMAQNRRLERREDIIEALGKEYKIEEIIGPHLLRKRRQIPRRYR